MLNIPATHAHAGIHEEMLKDGVRTRSYMKAILDNAFQVCAAQLACSACSA